MKKLVLLTALNFLLCSLYAQNVGVGTATPVYKLDVNGRMRVKSNPLGNQFATSGIWFDDYRDGSDRIFAGMQDSLRWGLWGGGSGGTGWKFNFNAKTGNVGMGRTNNSLARLELDEEDGYNMSFYKAGNYAGSIYSTDSTLTIYPAYGGIFCFPSPCSPPPPKDLILVPPSSFFSSVPGRVGIQTNSPTAKLQVDGNVMVGSGSPASGYLLSVNGKVICTETRIQLSSAWPDYVFSKNYRLRTIAELEKFVQANNHLPNIPSAAEIEKQKGFDLGDIQKRMLEKVEELTLYIIQLKKENEQLQKRVEALENK